MICRIYDVQGGTVEQYDAVNERIDMEKPEGAHAHIAVKTDSGFMVIEVWDSTEHIERFMEARLGEVMQDAEVPDPKITEFEVHNLDWVG